MCSGHGAGFSPMEMMHMRAKTTTKAKPKTASAAKPAAKKKPAARKK